MELFKVYDIYDVAPVRANGVHVYDAEGREYLDLYGGHGVISIGHSHPEYVSKISNQLQEMGFYSNAVAQPLQEALASKLGQVSGYEDFQLFLCNSGAEANENALKIASFQTGKSKVIAFKNAFHGRTSAALNVTDFPNLSAPINRNGFPVEFLEMNDFQALQSLEGRDDICAVIIEGIQGVGGLDQPSSQFLQQLSAFTKVHEALLILDEIQSGYGRTGKFFAHQHAEVQPDIITIAKGMGNGFPVGGVLVHPNIPAKKGMLGTTFGGNHLACAAAISVLEVIEKEDLVQQADRVGTELTEQLQAIPQIKKVRGKGLMLGVELDFPVGELRKKLLYEEGIFTGGSSNKNLLRILPPLSITKNQLAPFVAALKKHIS